MSEQLRLKEYYPGFDESVVNAVAEVAQRQRSSSWEQIRSKLPDNSVFSTENSSIELMDILPKDYDETWVYHLPMGNPLADHMQLRIATLAAAKPDKRIIAIGNPSGPGQSVGKIPAGSLRAVWKGNLRPTIDPVMRYLGSQQIEQATHIGFSYGAEKAAAASQYSEKYDQQVPSGLFMEPVAIKQRSLLGLGRDFNSTAAALEGYVKASASNPVEEANKRTAEKSHGLVGYALGLLRMSNIAIAHALTDEGFGDRVDNGLASQAEMQAHLVWGTESELATHGLMIKLANRLQAKFGVERVSTMEMVGQKHAMGDDIFLHTAIVLQNLNR